MLAEFQDSLSRNLQYSPRNTDTHIMYKNTLASYTMMHSVYFLSVIALHRAYMPFLPLRCSEPVGPLDEPIFPVDKMIPPDNFWNESARELFKAARQMMDLVVTCQERGALVENCLVGFAIYNAAFIGIYAAHFPHMDPDGSLSSKPASGESNLGQTQARKVLDILRDMRPRLKMAVGWFRTLNRLHSYFSKAKKDFGRHASRKAEIRSDSGDQLTNGIRPVREGGAGACIEEFKLLEKLFLDFGIIEDRLPESGAEEDTTMTADVLPDHIANASDAGSATVKSEPGETREPVALDCTGGRRESWIPINGSGIPPLPGSDRERRPSLPIPPSRPLQSPSYTLPSLQHHPDGPLFNNTSPSLRSIASSSPSYASPPATQPQSQFLAAASSTRLQPLNSWLASRQQPPPPPPPYSQSLPPINAATTQPSLTMFPLPGSVNYGMTSPPATTDSGDNNYQWSVCLGGDDLLAFLDGCECDQWPSMSTSEIGIPTGWLSTVWTEFGR